MEFPLHPNNFRSLTWECSQMVAAGVIGCFNILWKLSPFGKAHFSNISIFNQTLFIMDTGERRNKIPFAFLFHNSEWVSNGGGIDCFWPLKIANQNNFLLNMICKFIVFNIFFLKLETWMLCWQWRSDILCPLPAWIIDSRSPIKYRKICVITFKITKNIFYLFFDKHGL